MRQFAIDLTWVRHNKVGGTESCVRNLLDGLSLIDTSGWKILLLLSKDNADSFDTYINNNCFSAEICDVYSDSQLKRVLWQNTKMATLLKERGVSICLEPVYGKPFFSTKKVSYITTIHDLQALHYPQYFNKIRVIWMKLSWLNAVNTSKAIVAISQYVKNDIELHYHNAIGKTKVIYDAVYVDTQNISNKDLLEKLGLREKEYYYTVSSLFLHKNLKTIVSAIAELKRRRSNEYYPLVVSGIGGRKRNELDQLIQEHDVEDSIIFTEFVSESERNMLYKNCKAFLFPSIFEGFGMPPLEAASFGAPVLTTRCTSIEEVTGGLLNYVDEPLNPLSWVNSIEKGIEAVKGDSFQELMSRYNKEVIAKRYLELLSE